jgi:hypothetical protein
MGERNGANAQTCVELKTAGWRARREIDELAAAGPAPLRSHGPASRPGPHRSTHAGHRNLPPAGSAPHADALITGIF